MCSLKIYMCCEDVPRPGYEVCVVPVIGCATIGSLFHWATSTVDEIRIERVTDRLVTDAQSAAAFWQALYRVCAHGALVRVEVAPPAEISDTAPPFPYLLPEMRQTIERTWTLDMGSDESFAFKTGISFGLVDFTPIFSSVHHRQIKRGKITQRTALEEARQKAGVLLASEFTLIANKRLLAFQEIEL